MAMHFGIESEYQMAQKPSETIENPRLSGSNRWPDSDNHKDTYQEYSASLDLFTACEAVAESGLPVGCTVNHQDLEDPLTKAHGGALVGLGMENGIKVARGLNLKDLSSFCQINHASAARIWNQESANKSFPNQDFESQHWWIIEESIPDTKRPGTDHSWCGMEIKSPVISDQREIYDGLPTFQGAVGELRNRIVIKLSPECGLHIHASPASASVDLKLAQRVAAVVRVLEEPFIYEICHPDRRRLPIMKSIGRMSSLAKNSENVKNWTLSSAGSFIHTLSAFRSTLQDRSLEEPHIFGFLVLLHKETIIEGLRIKLQHESRPGGPTYRCDLAVHPQGTMEFRYPQSSFRPEWPHFWLILVQKIFEICEERDETFFKRFQQLYELGTRQEAVGWETWLEELGLSDYRQVCRHHRDESKYELDILPPVDINKMWRPRICRPVG